MAQLMCILSNTDTGAITGSDAGDSTTKIATSVIFTKQGLTVIILGNIVDDNIGTKVAFKFVTVNGGKVTGGTAISKSSVSGSNER